MLIESRKRKNLVEDQPMNIKEGEMNQSNDAGFIDLLEDDPYVINGQEEVQNITQTLTADESYVINHSTRNSETAFQTNGVSIAKEKRKDPSVLMVKKEMQNDLEKEEELITMDQLYEKEVDVKPTLNINGQEEIGIALNNPIMIANLRHENDKLSANDRESIIAQEEPLKTNSPQENEVSSVINSNQRSKRRRLTYDFQDPAVDSIAIKVENDLSYNNEESVVDSTLPNENHSMNQSVFHSTARESTMPSDFEWDDVENDSNWTDYESDVTHVYHVPKSN